jgi:hypothetical protein
MDQPNVKAKASTPESKNSVPNCRSAMGLASDLLKQPSDTSKVSEADYLIGSGIVIAYISICHTSVAGAK